MAELTCIGELLVDMISEEKSGLKDTEGFVKRPGGAPANVAVAASRMGAEVELIASVGEDEFGDFLLDKIMAEDVDIGRVSEREESTTLAFASLDADAEPHFSFYREADQHIGSEQLSGIESDTVHVGSLPLTDEKTSENIFNLMQDLEASVSFDPNLRPELMSEGYRKRLEKMIEFTDILFSTEEELEFFGGLEKIRDKVDEVVITRGARGAEVYAEENVLKSEPPETDGVDTTGAGDALTGAYLTFRVSEGLGREKALDLAVKSAAISITDKGAMSALPFREDIE